MIKTVTPALLLGIVAADLKVEEMYALQPDYAKFLQFLTKKYRRCPPTKFDFCKLETLRTTDYSNTGINVTQRACSTQNCTRFDPPTFTCSASVLRRKPFCDTGAYSFVTQACCADCNTAVPPGSGSGSGSVNGSETSNLNVAIGAGVGVPVVLIIVAVVIVLVVKGVCAGGAGAASGGGGSAPAPAPATGGGGGGNADGDGHDSWGDG